MPDSFLAVCENFRSQSDVCRQMGSPFYAELLRELADLIANNRDNLVGNTLAAWHGIAKQDAVALRFVAALHYLVITEADSELQAIYPPQQSLIGKSRADALQRSISRHQDFIIDYIKSPPQTNEVGRSVVLLGGFLEVAKRFGPELDIFEIGASAGLNMAFDQYFYQTESWQWGDPASDVSFKPNWSGNAPPLGPLKIQRRSACDLSPIDLASQKDRLLSYLWPDQVDRIQRTIGALNYAANRSLNIERSEASQWLLKQWRLESSREHTRQRPKVFFHSIIWQYFNAEQKADFHANMNKLASQASDSSPVIWMRLEPAAEKQHAELTITVWPGKSEHHLADSGFHGEWVRWVSR
ncbi:MAG: DUF2332 family protein [Arenicella sp.]|nr:DUF2332 family protein [Arenicella sp.]